MELDSAAVPAEPCLFADDTTIERSARGSPSKAAGSPSCPPEGEIFSIAAGRYSGTPDLGVLSPPTRRAIRIDRHRRRPEHIDAATLASASARSPACSTASADARFREQGYSAAVAPCRNPVSATGTQTRRHGAGRTRPLTPPRQASRCRWAPSASLAPYHSPRTTPPGITGLPGAIERGSARGRRHRPHDRLRRQARRATVRIAGLLRLAEHTRDGCDSHISLATSSAAIKISDYLTEQAEPAYDAIERGNRHRSAVPSSCSRYTPPRPSSSPPATSCAACATLPKAADLAAPCRSSDGAGLDRPPPRPAGRGAEADLGATWTVRRHRQPP